MIFVEELKKQPNHCVFAPQIGPTHPDGFVIPIGDFHPGDSRFQAGVSVVALRDIANKFPQVGLVPRDELTLALAERDALRAEIEDLRAQMGEYDKELDAISVLRARGYQPQKRTGRPPNKPAAKAA